MKTRFLNKMAGLLAVLLLFSCTGKFEEYNTDNTGFTDEQKTYDYNTFGVWLKVGSINSIFYFLHKAAEPFNCLEQDNLA